MELDRDLFASESMRQQVDLHRLFTETVETLVDDVHQRSIPIGENLAYVHTSTLEICRRVREAGFDRLKGRQWIDVIGMDRERFPEFIEALDGLEAVIEEYGRTVSVQDPQAVRNVLRVWRKHYPGAPRDIFISCLAETAVNQEFEARRIGRIEMSLVRDRTDQDLARENAIIVDLVRRRIADVLS